MNPPSQLLSTLVSAQNLPSSIGVVFFVAAIVIGVTAFYKWRKNAALKYEFITIITHKFRTPLSHIKYISEMLVESEKEPSNLDGIRQLQKSNLHLIGLTNTLIELTESKNQSQASYAFKTIALCQTIQTIADSMRLSFQEKNISLSVQCDEAEIYTSSDLSRLEFAFQTVLENAYTYTPTGGVVSVGISSAKHKAHILVTDNGIGIDRADISRIFSKFHRAENARRFDTEGLGVGLFMTKKVMKRLHGNIKAFSEGKNRGSTFELIFPLAHHSDTPSEKAR